MDVFCAAENSQPPHRMRYGTRRSCAASGRFWGFLRKHCERNAAAGADRVAGRVGSTSGPSLARDAMKKMTDTAESEKRSAHGGFAVSISVTVHPTDQMSAGFSYF